MKLLCYTDGACSGNPGPMGIGSVITSENNEIIDTISKYLGNGTNNIAEFMAVYETLVLINLELKLNESDIIIYSDSQLVVNTLNKTWKPKTNLELINKINYLILKCKSIEFIKVKGHSDNVFNNMADKLATNAIR